VNIRIGHLGGGEGRFQAFAQARQGIISGKHPQCLRMREAVERRVDGFKCMVGQLKEPNGVGEKNQFP